MQKATTIKKTDSTLSFFSISNMRINEPIKIKVLHFIEGFIVLMSPTYYIVMAIISFILGDLFLGMMLAKKEKVFDHKKIWNTGRKLLAYTMIIYIAYFFQLAFIKNIEVMKVVAGIIAFVELKSIDSKFEKLFDFSLFKDILRQFKK